MAAAGRHGLARDARESTGARWLLAVPPRMALPQVSGHKSGRRVPDRAADLRPRSGSRMSVSYVYGERHTEPPDSLQTPRLNIVALRLRVLAARSCKRR